MSIFRLGRARAGVAAISAGTVAGHAVTLLATPILSRVYTPDAFGEFAALIAIVAIAATAGSLRLETAIPIATDDDAENLVKVGIWSSLIGGLICALGLSLTGHQNDSQPIWLWSSLLIYLVWVTAAYQILTAFWLRSHQYAALARRNLLQGAGTAGGQLLFSRWIQTSVGLAAGLALGRTLGLVSLVLKGRSSTDKWADARPVSATMKRYWKFPVLFMPAAILNVLGTQIPILIIAGAYGPASAGNLAQAITLGAIPAALLGTAIASVVLAEMAARVRAGELDQRARYLRVSRALAPIGLVWLLALVLVAPFLLPVILGPGWATSGQFAAALAPSVSLGLIVSPLTVVTTLYERPVLNLLLDCGRVAMVACAGWLAWWLGLGAVADVLAMSVAMAAVYILTWFICLSIVSGGNGAEGRVLDG